MTAQAIKCLATLTHMETRFVINSSHLKKFIGALVLGLFLSSNVFAEQVYYCSDKDANGFQEGKKRKPKLITQERFKLFYDLKHAIKAEDKIKMRFSHEDYIRIYNVCARPFPKTMPEIVICNRGAGEGFVFNEKTLNYSRAYFWAHALGFKEDTMMVAYGNCEKF